MTFSTGGINVYLMCEGPEISDRYMLISRGGGGRGAIKYISKPGVEITSAIQESGLVADALNMASCGLSYRNKQVRKSWASKWHLLNSDLPAFPSRIFSAVAPLKVLWPLHKRAIS